MKRLLFVWIGLGIALSAAGADKNPPPPVSIVPTPPAPKPVEDAPVWTPSESSAPPPSAPARRSAAELEKLAAPIAIYPDPLIATLLPASAYPLEIVQAARFVANTNNLSKIDAQPWDATVKSVAKIPGIIQKMNEDLSWTVELGQAFVEQPMDLMNAIQAMRTRAQAAGTLKTTPQQVVTTTNAVVERTYEGQVVYVTNTVIQVQPANKEVVYVPSYSPSTVYVDDDDDDAAAVISFGVGVAFGAAVWGNCDWHYGGCYWGGYPPPPPYYPPPYYPPPGAPKPPPAGRPPGTRPPGERPPGGRPPGGQPPGVGRPPGVSTQPAQRWQPDQNRLRNTGAPGVATRDARGWGSSSALSVQRPATGAAATRPAQVPATGAGVSRPAAQPSYPGQRPAAPARPAPSTGAVRPSTPAPQPSARPATPSAAGGARPSSSSSYTRPAPQSPSAFSGVNSGGGARSSSSRGAASRGGGGGYRGGGGGGRGR